ncbi:efflux RND transporter periplasmic adaptor subunit [Ekhidna sp.]|uniref:efflux RND transporter periplasmic adaptor subunit n=1 Tax=Ekhidna sp. TaxID=2608089 RepID=UPI003B50D4F7
MKTIYQYINKALVITLMGAAIISCSSKTAEQTEEHHEEENRIELTQTQFDQANIKIGSIEKRVMGSELRVNGVIDVPPQSNISINMPYGGFVKYTEMLPGTSVRKGQLLVTIENPEFIQFQQEYLESLANQEFLKAEFERQQELYNEKVASGKSFQQAKSAFLANEARIKTMEARLKMIGLNPSKIGEGNVVSFVSIYSPVTGQVREVYTNVGKYINPQDVIMDITNSDDLHVELTVYENDIPLIKKGQRIRFSLANAPDQWREAEVFLVGSGVREDRSVTVHGHLMKKDQDLLPGMYVSAKIETGSNETWAVPEESIVRFGGRHYVFALGNERIENEVSIYDFEMIEINKGFVEDGFTQISLINSSIDITSIDLVTQGAFTVLAKAKNTEEEGGHGH